MSEFVDGRWQTAAQFRRREAELVAKIQRRHQGETNVNAYKTSEYADVLARFAHQYAAEWSKYDSQENTEWIVGYLSANQSVPSITSVRRAIQWLVETGRIERVDGGSEASDKLAEINAAEANLQKAINDADAAPLSKAEVEEFASLSRADLARRYWADDGYNTFRIRYDRACREYGFTVPPQPTPIEAAGGIELTADEYKKMTAYTVAVRQHDPRFRAAVERLIAAGEL